MARPARAASPIWTPAATPCSRALTGNWTVSSYNGHFRLLARIAPEGNATLYAYDDASCISADKRCTQNVKTVTSVAKAGTGLANRVQSFTYDAVGNLTLVDGPRTDVTDTLATAYDSERRPTQTTDAAGKQTRTAYDDLDRPIRTTRMLAAGEGGNRVEERVYNADDTVQSVRKAVGTPLAQTYATYTYTPNGQADTSADAKGNLTVYLYDGFDRLWRTHYPLPANPGWANGNDYEENAYDANGNATALRRRSGQVVTQTWDNLNRLTARTYPSAADNVQYAYDLRGLRTAAQFASGAHAITYVWDGAGRLTGTTAGGKTLAHQYDRAGNRTRTTWPDGFFTTTAYDSLNRPSQIQENGSVALASYAYDDLGRRTTVTLGNGTSVQRAYDTQGSMSSLKNFLASPSQEVQYAYVRVVFGNHLLLVKSIRPHRRFGRSRFNFASPTFNRRHRQLQVSFHNPKKMHLKCICATC